MENLKSKNPQKRIVLPATADLLQSQVAHETSDQYYNVRTLDRRGPATTEAVDPAVLARKLGGSWFGSYGAAPCPCCQPERRRHQNALTIAGENDRLLLNCKKAGCDFRDLLVACGIRPGEFEVDMVAIEQARRERATAEAKALDRAESLWRQGDLISGTHGEAYLRSRAITCALPSSLRWIRDIYHQPSGHFCAAMVAKVQSATGQPMGIHRTFFTKQGHRLSRNAKMMLGPCRGGAVRLTEAQGPLVVAEGIETALTLACGMLRQPARIWAALSTSGVAGLDLPPEPGQLIIAPDGDDAGQNAANRLAERADAIGWSVSLLPAPEGKDWNDVLMVGVCQ